MRKVRLVVTSVAVALAAATSAGAQEASVQERSQSTVQVTPYVLLGSDASSGVGAAVAWPLAGDFSLELESSYRSGGVAPMSANLSLLYDLPSIARVTPYVAAGVGLDQYVTADTALRGNVVTQSSTALSVNAGGGLKVRATENWGVRTDARWSNGLGSRAPERWRLYNGVTFGGSDR